jgi:uncharacterized protein (TIGR03435 family)
MRSLGFHMTSLGRYRLSALAAVAVLGPGLFAQAPAGRPEFEVASIKPSPPDQANQVNGGLHIDGSQVSCVRFSLNDYIGMAYNVKRYQISSPDWMASERFDITAKIPAGDAAKNVPKMFQALLEDRFQMKMHRESKELPAYALVIGKSGPKIQESPADSSHDGGTHQDGGTQRREVNVAVSGRQGGATVNYGNGSYFTFADDRFEGRKLSAALMSDVLARFTDRPIVDMTNLKGVYDFVVDFSPEDFRAMGIRAAIAAGVAIPPQVLQQVESASGDSLLNAVEKLGLKLESRKAPIEVLVIDHSEKTPTDN